ncbi:nitrous oxide reductase accessory protein NosL [Labrenzia sp. PHM005]|uniref:nitrous oxide reductase accessory protein NosL n=1 Tax=Labrenzia sp. PHM005 TaxID=2590016 RepID=UPI0011403574|nr:nitrous oxide reductase accessory protein NosL [Labrenzia sp. PHM005]QDG79340.1 copper resistance protein CopZ [Labrenzia sp. PHM005]
MIRLGFVFLAASLLVGCQEEIEIAKPAAIKLTPEAAGHYCQMTVLEHDGPKAQIHLAGNPFPVWFTQVRDAVAFKLSPEETDEIAAIYVNDMDKAVSWTQPGNDNWIDADEAWFVTGSNQAGGMGAPETIPFGTETGAREFADKNGGDVVRLADISEDYVLAPVDVSSALQLLKPGSNGVH